VLVDKLNPTVDVSYLGQSSTGISPAVNFEESTFTVVSTDLATVSFTVPASMPEEFTFKFLVNGTISMAPVDGTYNLPVDKYECSSNGMTITIKAADESATNINIDDEATPTNGNDVTVKKNGVSVDTVVTCTYYIRAGAYGSAPFFNDYSKSAFFVYYDDGTVTENATISQVTYYTYGNVYIGSYPGSDEGFPSGTTVVRIHLCIQHYIRCHFPLHNLASLSTGQHVLQWPWL
jgi:hypothetical protein